MNRRHSITIYITAAAICLTAVAFVPPLAHAETHHVILTGSGGEEPFRKQFYRWTARLALALTDKLGVPTENVHVLRKTSEHDPESQSIGLESLRDTFETLRNALTKQDDLYVYIIGHGSYIKRRSVLHIPGPDLAADVLDSLLDPIDARRIVVLNSTSASAGFVNALSGPNRVVCTATKSIDEFNATQFMEYFIEGIEEGTADRNHDERVSFLEACEQAAQLTAAWYLGESLIPTEHAILDDNGDALGTRLPIGNFSDEGPRDAHGATRIDGALADRCFLKDYSFSAAVPQDIIDAYLSALEEVEDLKSKKSELDTSAYYAALEKILLRAARANRKIRALNPSPDVSP